MTIKILEKTTGCLPNIIDIGDWIDLRTATDIHLKAPQAHKMHIHNKGKADTPEVRVRDVDFQSTLIYLGVCMEIPKGYEAILAPRSSTFLKYGLLQTNSFGVIYNSYKGDTDEWKLPVVATRDVIIPKGTRICQFRIQLSQKATFWQKLKWFFSSIPKLQQVASLNNQSRGGFGSTGNN